MLVGIYMNTTRSILDLFTIFPFSIVLALALVEAFKTVVEEGKFIHWDRLYSLGSFLLLILPFYQGMNRYLLVTYGDAASLPTPYAPFLVSAAFMVESALFFVLSRTLRSEEWQHFYWVVFVLLVIDSLWWFLHAPPEATIQSWMILNLVTSIFILLLVLLGRGPINLQGVRLASVRYAPIATKFRSGTSIFNFEAP